jgi:hypothetical protein
VAHPNLPVQNPYTEHLATELGGDAGSDIGESLSRAWRNTLGVTINQSQVDRAAGSS